MADEVIIVEADPRWGEAFAIERDRMLRVLDGSVVAIEHIGSTAVPGLASKPIIDLLCGFRTFDEATAAVPLLVAAGWEYPEDLNARIVDRRFLKLTKDGVRTHHAHLIVHDGPLWNEYVIFRDRLRASPGLRDDYEALKRELAERLRDQRDSYTASKGTFVAGVVAGTIRR